MEHHTTVLTDSRVDTTGAVSIIIGAAVDPAGDVPSGPHGEHALVAFVEDTANGETLFIDPNEHGDPVYGALDMLDYVAAFVRTAWVH